MTSDEGEIVHYYRATEPPHSLLPSIKESLKALGLESDAKLISAVQTESCFNVLSEKLTEKQTQQLEWLLAETFDNKSLSLEKSNLDISEEENGKRKRDSSVVMEFGPRLTFTSAFSSNAVGICSACHLPISRLERSKRFLLDITGGDLSHKAIAHIKGVLHDKMTEQEYSAPMTTFDSGAQREQVVTVPIMKEGRAALEKINVERGLGFDDFDLDYYTNLFKVRT